MNEETNDTAETTEVVETPEVVEDTTPKIKSKEEAFQNRLGYQTRKIAELDSKLKAYEQILAAQNNKTVEPIEGQKTVGRTYEDGLREAQEHLQAQAFVKTANEVYKNGKEKFQDWDETVGTLRNLGVVTGTVVNEPILLAAFATPNADAVLHFLGTDIEEAERISNLPPVQMGVEMAKLSQKLAQVKPKDISKAPAPITPTSPVSTGTGGGVDLEKVSKTGSVADFIAANRKAGSRFFK